MTPPGSRNPGPGANPAPLARRLRRGARRGRRYALRCWLDARDWLSGRRDPLQPPRRLGLPSQVAPVGERLLDAMIARGGLSPGGSVLDIGCGPGRMAAPVSRYLDPGAGARYEGFDVMPRSIEWCRRAISSRHPHFHFQVADLHNAQYNPGGSQRATEFTFPYGDESFDVAIACSLFTHLRPIESQRYLEEARRVLKPGGRLLGSWFLINDEAEELLEAGHARFPGILGGTGLRIDERLTDAAGNRFRAAEREVPEHQIAAYETDVREWHADAGLRVVEALYGNWCGREQPPEAIGQDLLLAERRS